MLRINIAQTYGKIAIETQQAPLSLQSTLPKVKIETEQAETISARKTEVTLSIDQYPSRHSYNMRNLSDSIRDYAQMGMQALMSGIGRRAAEGTQMANPKSGGVREFFANLAVQNSQPEPVEIELVSIERPQIDWEPQTTPGEYKPATVDISLERGSVENSTGRTQVVTSMAQYPSIRFWTTGNRTDMKI